MKVCELRSERSETEQPWRPAGTGERQSNRLSLSPSLWASPSVSTSIFLSLSFCLLAVVKWMSPLYQCYLGEIDSLASVLSAAICWCFHIAVKWGEGVLKPQLQPWLPPPRRGADPFCHTTSAVKAPIPQSWRVPRASLWKFFFFLQYLQMIQPQPRVVMQHVRLHYLIKHSPAGSAAPLIVALGDIHSTWPVEPRAAFPAYLYFMPLSALSV